MEATPILVPEPDPAEDAHTISRKGARMPQVEVITRGERRRVWTVEQKRPPRSPAKRLSRRISSGANRQLKSSPVAAAALTSYHKVLLIKLGPHVDNIKSCLEPKPCPLGHDRFIRSGAQRLRRRGTASVELTHQGSRRYSRLYFGYWSCNRWQ